ncbi:MULTISPECIES: PAS and ANTAR domain-containing protein [unclassified Gordonia (in: high G+C Gram-positive bacteria)]|uniref:PAS and ANTAR domain-containing protein n=1 Tax=unclassified Gordonia (in: high G+C Gram-positive bacteria) TaxID=2657482 RepID=UPI001F05ADD9|nr:PAS and ANTAR domain-containing protein [Gordonia sp. PDNC005]
MQGQLDHPAADRPAFRYGRFWYYRDDDRWEWSDQLARLHGYESAESVAPTIDLLLAHKHPDDRERVAELIERVRRAGAPFSSEHRIIDRRGSIIPVIVIGDLMHDPGGRRRGTFGFYVASSTGGEVPDSANSRGRMDIDEMVRRRATIERVKGAVMLAYRLNAQQAFDLLVWRSQESNVKLYELAAAIDARLADVDLPSRARSSFDRIVLSAHEDVSP